MMDCLCQGSYTSNSIIVTGFFGPLSLLFTSVNFLLARDLKRSVVPLFDDLVLGLFTLLDKN